MTDILFLCGAPAFSVFRLQGLQQRIQSVVPEARVIGAEYWHFVKLNGPLADEGRQQLAALLEERPVEAEVSGALFLVTPRIGTISPWSSKATDIAWNSGLDAVERIEPLLARAKLNLRAIREFRVRLKYADGALGLPEAAPFDTIILAAAASHVPPALLQQLALGGRMVLPLGSADQYLVLIERRAEGYVETRLDGVRFVPLLSGLE